MNILKTIAAKVLGRKFTDNMENIQKEKTMKRRNHPVRWWDLECEEIIKRRKEKHLEKDTIIIGFYRI